MKMFFIWSKSSRKTASKKVRGKWNEKQK